MAWVINGALGARMALGMAALCVVSLGACYWLWRRQRQRETGRIEAGHNPFELDQAIKFGLLFGAVVFVANLAQVYLGEAGLYLASAIAGLTDVDAITLAMADLAKSEGKLDIAARAILIAVLSNTLVKSAMAVSLGSPELRRAMLPIAGALVAAGAATAVFI